MKVDVRVGIPKIPTGVGEIELPFMITLRGEEASKKPIALVFVVDVSLSMDGEKIFRAKQGLIEVAKMLSPGDLISIISFCDKVRHEGTYDARDFVEIESKIASLKLCPGTNLYEALKAGIEELKKISEGRLSRLVLVTDGRPTTGVKDKPKHRKKYEELAKSSPSPIIAIGVGTDYNETLLALISRYSGGYFEHVVAADALRRVIEEQVIRLSKVVADNVILRINPTKYVKDIIVPHIKTIKKIGDAIAVRVPEISVDEPFELVGKFIVKTPEEEGKVKLATVQVSYREFLKGTRRAEVGIEVEAVPKEEAEEARPDREVMMKYRLYSIADELWAAVSANDRRKVMELLSSLSDVTLSLGEMELYSTTVDIMEEMRRGGKDALKKLLSALTKVSKKG